MKFLLKLLVGLAVLAVVIVVVSFFTPRTFRVERSIVIQARPEKIYALVAELKSWKDWGVWYERDPAMVVTYSPVTTGVGAWTEWRSKSEGNGKATITEAVASTLLVYRLEFQDTGLIGKGSFLVSPIEGGAVKIASIMEGDLGTNPVMRITGPFLDRMIGPDFAAGLAKLKRIAEVPAK
jgi:hypothetical protein